MSADVEFVDIYATQELDADAVAFFHADQRIESELVRAIGLHSFRFLLPSPQASTLEVRYGAGSLARSIQLPLIRGGLSAAWIFEEDRSNSMRALEQHWR
ncbi:MAG: hypothetical protein WD226_05155 [Planctomycetota bacterium]